MEFVPQREFFHPHVNTKMKRKSTAENVTKIPYISNLFTRYLYQATSLHLLSSICLLVYQMENCTIGRRKIWSRPFW